MALTELVKEPDGCRCTVCKLLAGMDEQDRNKMLGWLSDLSITQRELSRHMRSNGMALGRDTIGSWRRGELLCGGINGAH